MSLPETTQGIASLFTNLLYQNGPSKGLSFLLRFAILMKIDAKNARTITFHLQKDRSQIYDWVVRRIFLNDKANVTGKQFVTLVGNNDAADFRAFEMSERLRRITYTAGNIPRNGIDNNIEKISCYADKVQNYRRMSHVVL